MQLDAPFWSSPESAYDFDRAESCQTEVVSRLSHQH
jgi:hypothetical protein